AQADLNGSDQWQTVSFAVPDFHDITGAGLSEWSQFGELVLADAVTLEKNKDGKEESVSLGAVWQGPAPEFRNLRWEISKLKGDAN
ncbi:MAG TPA: hypothetical protein VGJ73_09575, partial [Verrucomicrobiae bacterium]